MPKTKAIITIQNVVASATLNQRVDLNAVVKGYPGVEYNPEQFPGLVFRLKRPKTATLIFTSGKMVCTGAKSEKESRRAVMTVVKELKKERNNHHQEAGLKGCEHRCFCKPRRKDRFGEGSFYAWKNDV